MAGASNDLQEQRFQLLVNAVVDYAIYMIAPDGTIATWNAGARRFKGYEADEIIGRPYESFFPPEDRAAGLPRRILDTAAAEGRFEGEGWRLRKDGSRFWAHVVVDAIREGGQLVGYAKITRDLTERKRIEEELEEARGALYQSQKLQALGELTGGIAHDFNNLLTVIRGAAELLRRPDLSPDKRDLYLSSIIDTTDRATALTHHLLAFGRRQALKPEVMQLNVRLDAIGEMIQRTFGSRYEVRLDLAPDLWLVEVDPTQLETALLNAAINARDAMPGGGSLTLATRNLPDTQEVEIAVRDYGEGMAPEVAARAFEPFFTTKAVGKGTGLGLSQIHGFAAQTGGRAEFDSAPGEGTTLRIVLPRTSNAPAIRDGSPQDASGPPAGLRVLLVEDNDQVRPFAENLLAELGCDVVTASCADEALALLDKEEVDLLFTDVVMPGMSGLQLATRVRERSPELPIILASGYSEELVRGAAASFEMVSKPYGLAQLSRAMGALTCRGADPQPVCSE
jgi:PAS domain S-box-containing protein